MDAIDKVVTFLGFLGGVDAAAFVELLLLPILLEMFDTITEELAIRLQSEHGIFAIELDANVRIYFEQLSRFHRRKRTLQFEFVCRNISVHILFMILCILSFRKVMRIEPWLIPRDQYGFYIY